MSTTIYDLARKAYADDPVANAEVEEIAEWWKGCASHLSEMGKLMKNQKKMTPECVKLLKKHLILFLVLWCDKVGEYKNLIYWKLHVLMCCFVNFCKVTGMGGRASAEGFENKHHLMAYLKAMMKPIL